MTIFLGLLVSIVCTIAANAQAGFSLSCASRKMSIGHAVTSILALSLYAGFLALTARPIFTVTLTLGTFGLLWAVNRLKINVLLEPLVFSDIFLLKQVHRHPQLYIAHAPARFFLLAGLSALLLITLLINEPAAPFLTALWRFYSSMVCFLPWIIFIAMLLSKLPCIVNRILNAYTPCFDPKTDAACFTPLGAAFLHVLHHTRRLRNGLGDLLRVTHLSSPGLETTNHMPHILLTQAESFCNIHRFAPDIEDDIIPHILKAMSQGRHGQLELDWSGAYTMRTEFSVLTGLDLRRLETFGFDPYLLAARYPVASLAHTLGKLGYRSVCIHPYDPTFFDRNLVMQHFGFNQFIDQEAFTHANTNGPYVSDPSVLNMALDLMQNTFEPLFVFVITMEAHGPWLPGRFGTNSAHETPLTHYLRHLRSLDLGVGNVLTRSKKLHRDMIFALYGDHVPSLDIVNGTTANSRATDYFVWSSCQYPLEQPLRNLRPESFGNEILHALNEITLSCKNSSQEAVLI